jgi:hypothetical protein
MTNTITNSKVQQIFDDLDKYREFCSTHGYVFDEAELYSNKSFVYRQFQKYIAGKPAKNQWELDYLKFKEQETAMLYM